MKNTNIQTFVSHLEVLQGKHARTILDKSRIESNTNTFVLNDWKIDGSCRCLGWVQQYGLDKIVWETGWGEVQIDQLTVLTKQSETCNSKIICALQYDAKKCKLK